jgi:hypothetical protein
VANKRLSITSKLERGKSDTHGKEDADSRKGRIACLLYRIGLD